MLNVLIVEPHDIARVGLRQILKDSRLARQIEADFRAKHAGETFQVLKRGPRMTPEQRLAVYRDGLTGMENEEIVQKHKISRRTLYRVMKDGGGRFSG